MPAKRGKTKQEKEEKAALLQEQKRIRCATIKKEIAKEVLEEQRQKTIGVKPKQPEAQPEVITPVVEPKRRKVKGIVGPKVQKIKHRPQPQGGIFPCPINQFHHHLQRC